MFIEIPKVYGRGFKVCSIECAEEMHWRETLSITNTEYKPRVKTNEV